MNRSLIRTLFIGAALLVPAMARADFTVSKNPTHDVSCVSGVCMPTAQNANLNVSELTNMLTSGDVTLKTGNGDSTAASVNISDAFGWPATSKLTLWAKNNISVKAPVVLSGKGSLALTYANGNPDGDLNFGNDGRIDFADLKSRLTINSLKYTLLNDVPSLAAAIRSNPTGNFALSKSGPGGYYVKAPIASFHGVLEGLGHEIQGLVISSSHAQIGLFRTNNGVLRNIHFPDAEINAYTYKWNAAVVAALNGGLIRHVTVGGTLTADSRNRKAGGIAGQNYGTISDCRSTVRVIGRVAGGLVGVNRQSGQLLRDQASGNVSAYAVAGGLVGAQYGKINESFASGKVIAAGQGGQAGGLAGGTMTQRGRTGIVTNSYATGSVQGAGYSGGLQGLNHAAEISYSYAIGSILGGTHIGGLWVDLLA